MIKYISIITIVTEEEIDCMKRISLCLASCVLVAMLASCSGSETTVSKVTSVASESDATDGSSASSVLEVVEPTVPAQNNIDLHAAFKSYMDDWEAVTGYQENEIYFIQDDYDGDGVQEAFGITGEVDEDFGGYYDVCIYFINSRGNILEVSSDNIADTPQFSFYGYLGSANENGEPQLITVSQDGINQKFLVWELSANGSASVSVIWGVWGGRMYEVFPSGQYMCFQQNEDGSYSALISSLTDEGHVYNDLFFEFDTDTGIFYPLQ